MSSNTIAIQTTQVETHTWLETSHEWLITVNELPASCL
jgi:hypothetical protein